MHSLEAVMSLVQAHYQQRQGKARRHERRTKTAGAVPFCATLALAIIHTLTTRWCPPPGQHTLLQRTVTIFRPPTPPRQLRYLPRLLEQMRYCKQ